MTALDSLREFCHPGVKFWLLSFCPDQTRTRTNARKLKKSSKTTVPPVGASSCTASALKKCAIYMIKSHQVEAKNSEERKNMNPYKPNTCRKFTFTKKAIESLPPHDPPPSREAEYSDTECSGLRLRVSKNGRRFFQHRYRFLGRKQCISPRRVPRSQCSGCPAAGK